MPVNTALYRELHEQPAVLERILADRSSLARLAEDIRRRRLSQVLVAARGSSDNAGRYAQYTLGAQNGLLVALATPSLFSVYGRPPRLDHTLVLGISQSGESPDIVAVLAEARRQGALTAVLTNAPASELAALGDHVIDLKAGPEKSVAATKSYTAQLAAIALLSACLAGRPELFEALDRLPEAAARALEMRPAIASLAPRYRYMTRCVVIGRGFNYATAFELALKLKELTYVVAEPYSSADFLHGPLALIEPGFPALVIAASGRLDQELEAFVNRLNESQAEVIVIGDVAACLALARVPLALPPGVPEWLSPLVTVIPGQLLAMYLAHDRDIDLDAPRGLSKVTRTR
jgi:glutamine---fructose-6-phosphate transaminase (isomerizing)